MVGLSKKLLIKRILINDQIDLNQNQKIIKELNSFHYMYMGIDKLMA